MASLLSGRDEASFSEQLDCTVSSPVKENDGSKDSFVSYLITTQSTFQSFQKPETTVRRRFTDFVFLYKTLCRDYVACAVPPLPDKQRMEYVRGDRFGPDFMSRRAHSLQRFLIRLSLHPVLRRADMLHIFLESADWNATMRSRALRTSVQEAGGNGSGGGGVFDNFTETFINAFTKLHRVEKRFVEVRDRTDRLDEDLSQIEKVVARVARREADLETDLHELAEQFQKLITLEPGIEAPIHAFAASVQDSAAGMRQLREVTERDYLGSLRDMQAYSGAVKNLLKAREQKQLDYEQLTDYLGRSQSDRDVLQAGGSVSSLGGVVPTGASNFLRNKLEDVRGVDHEQSRRERQRKLEMQVDKLMSEVETAHKHSELFDEEVVREVADFERIKRVEFKRQLGGLATAHIGFYGDMIAIWERYIRETEVDEELGSPT